MNDPEVRNPRYAGATIGDLVRALVRPKKPKAENPDEDREKELPTGLREERPKYSEK